VSAVDDLLRIATGPLSASPVTGPVGDSADLGALLSTRNGFYAFDAALHVLPAGRGNEISVEAWNHSALWRNAYRGLSEEWFFFAEDAFGGQFGLGRGGVVGFDPETGDIELLARSIEDWAKVVLDDCEMLTGWPLAHEWQVQHGPLRPGRRLIPKVPFVLGGDFVVSNLYDGDTVMSLRYRGEVASQLHDLPDGTRVRLRLVGEDHRHSDLALRRCPPVNRWECPVPAHPPRPRAPATVQGRTVSDRHAEEAPCSRARPWPR
jgi:hypothetical protein